MPEQRRFPPPWSVDDLLLTPGQGAFVMRVERIGPRRSWFGPLSDRWGQLVDFEDEVTWPGHRVRRLRAALRV
jgi:hypothetical protein